MSFSSSWQIFILSSLPSLGLENAGDVYECCFTIQNTVTLKNRHSTSQLQRSYDYFKWLSGRQHSGMEKRGLMNSAQDTNRLKYLGGQTRLLRTSNFGLSRSTVPCGWRVGFSLHTTEGRSSRFSCTLAGESDIPTFRTIDALWIAAKNPQVKHKTEYGKPGLSTLRWAVWVFVKLIRPPGYLLRMELKDGVIYPALNSSAG